MLQFAYFWNFPNCPTFFRISYHISLLLLSLLFFATMSDTPFASFVYPTVDQCHAILYETISLLLFSSNPHPAASTFDDLKGLIKIISRMMLWDNSFAV
jgi:hypothetical protein